jgi:hypothetical protein
MWITLIPQVNSYGQDYSTHDGSKGIWGAVFPRTFDLTRSNNTYDRLGAAAAIGMSLPDEPELMVRCDARDFQ